MPSFTVVRGKEIFVEASVVVGGDIVVVVVVAGAKEEASGGFLLFLFFFGRVMSESSKKGRGFTSLFLFGVDQRLLVPHFAFFSFFSTASPSIEN